MDSGNKWSGFKSQLCDRKKSFYLVFFFYTLYLLFFETGSHIARVGFNLAVDMKPCMPGPPASLCPQSNGIIGLTD